MSHIQFNRDTRVELAILLSAGKNQTQAGRILGIHRTNVCKEINHNKDPDGIYRGVHAQKRYLTRRKLAKQPYRKIENDLELQKNIVQGIKKLWSPEQITGRLERVSGRRVVCPETIYTFIYENRPDLVKYFRHQKCKYRKKRGSRVRMELNRASKIRRITERPLVVNERSRIGDWEDDTVLGKEKVQRIYTCVERKSGYAMAEKLDVVTAEIVTKNIEKRFKQIPKNKRKTLTRDNGVEFGDYDKTLEKKLDMEVYRAREYCSWERGSNENWNGLLRQFFPKGMYFATITKYDVQRAVRMLNNRPRKRLGYSTPREVFMGCSDSD
jgi:IS30 family transposase